MNNECMNEDAGEVMKDEVVVAVATGLFCPFDAHFDDLRQRQ